MSEAPPTKWTKWRDLFAAMRELLVVLAIVLLLVAPATVRSTLERAGISSFAGIEFDLEGLAESESEMEIAELEVEHLKEQIAQLSEQLNKPSGATSSRFDPKDQVVSKLVRQMAIDTEIASNRIKSSRSKTRHYLQEARSHVALTPPEKLFAPAQKTNAKPAPPSEQQLRFVPSGLDLSSSNPSSSSESTPIQWPIQTTITQPAETVIPPAGNSSQENAAPRIGSIRASLQGLSNH